MRILKRLLIATACLCLFFPPLAHAARPTDRQFPSGSGSVENLFDGASPEFRHGSNVEIPGTRVGLALGGGGTRGAAHVGVLKVLVEAGVPIDCIAGTSIGAIVGGMYAAGVPLPELEKQFRNNRIMKAFMAPSPAVRVVTAPLHVVPYVFGKKHFDGIYKGGLLSKFLAKELPDDRKNIQDLSIPFCAVALNLVDGHVYALTKGDLILAMQASSAVPVLRRPVRIGDDLFVDGAVIQNLPVDEARRALGAHFVIAVDVDERFKKESVESFLKLGSVAKRLITLELARRDFRALTTADIVIHPNVDGIGLLSTKNQDAANAMAAGESAARAALPTIIEALQKRGIRLNPPATQLSEQSAPALSKPDL